MNQVGVDVMAHRAARRPPPANSGQPRARHERGPRHGVASGRSVRSLCIGGGVAKNARLRERLAADPHLGSLKLVMPPMSLCADNGAMIAGLGAILFRKGAVSPLDLDAVATAQTNGKAKVRRRAPR